MSRVAFLFPGQGAQIAGMGKDFIEASPAAAAIYKEAGQILGWDVQRLCTEGPQTELDRTAISQPAILTTSWAIVQAMREAGLKITKDCSAAAGLSMGEYTALLMAGALKFPDALRLVRRRGELMEQACDQNPGTMMSVIGLDDEIVEAICAEAREVGMVVAANFNCPGQVVISGTREAVLRAGELAKQHGAKRLIQLAVSGAFHSTLMEPAADKLEPELADTPFTQCAFMVIANVSAEPVSAPDEIRRSLASQVKSPVRWTQSVQRLVAEGYNSFVEIGPGKVISGLMRRIVPEAKIVNVSTVENMRALADS